MILTKQEIIEALQHNVCTVKFTKVNGEVREMPCTLREDLVPKYERKTEIKEPKPESNTLSVWCTDKNAWRSFRVESVMEVSINFGMPVIS